MIPRIISRRVRPIWMTAVASAAWANRDDLRRWIRFIRRAIEERNSRKFSDLLTEARVRVAVSANPLLRRDSALMDLTVSNGVVTLLTTSTIEPESHNSQTHRLKRVKGISEVISRTA